MSSRGHFEKCRERERERKLTTYRGFSIKAVVFPTLSIQAVFQCVFRDPLVRVHAALTSNTTDFCRTLKLNLEPLVFVVNPGWPSTCSWACSLEMKATVVRPVSLVILWRSLDVPWFDLSILHTESVQTQRGTGRDKTCKKRMVYKSFLWNFFSLALIAANLLHLGAKATTKTKRQQERP